MKFRSTKAFRHGAACHIRPWKRNCDEEINAIQCLLRAVHLNKYMDSYVPEDKRHFVKCINDVWVENQEDFHIPEALRKIYLPPSNFWVYENDSSKIIGCGGIELDGKSAYISRVAVNRSYRGKGIGVEIMHNLLADCKTMGANLIWMESDEFQVAANTLYEKLGFNLKEKKLYHVDHPKEGRMEYRENVWEKVI